MAPERKRRKVEIEEIKFDPAARQEYLTGFHKRKQERIQTARATAAKKAKEEKVKERRQIREQRKEDLSAHIAAVNSELRKQNPDLAGSDSGAEVNGDDSEWTGIEDAPAAEALDQEGEDEFVDEEKYTTVTVEAMPTPGEEDSEDEPPSLPDRASNGTMTNSKPVRTRDSSKTKPAQKKKKLKFRYESKAERQATRQKQKLKGQRAAKARRQKAS